MTITVEAFTGTHTVGATEWSMPAGAATPQANTTPGIYQLFVDLAALDAGDAVELKVYEKCRTGDTQRAVYAARFANVQAAPLWVSPTLVLGIGWDMALKKIAGTDRAIAWRISKVA